MPNSKAIVEHIKDFADKYPDEIGLAIERVLLEVLTESKKICPVKTGYLRGSGYVSTPSLSYQQILVTIGYSAEYAYWVHENIEAHFSAAGTKAKFLEEPLQMYADRIPTAIHDECMRIMGA